MAKEKNKLEVVLSILDKATAPLQAFNKRIEKLQEPVRKVSNKLAVFGQAAGFGKLRDAAGGVASAFGNVASEAGALAVKVTAGVGIVGGALFGLVKMTSDAGDSFDELSTKAGVSAEFFQKAAYAAGFASISQEDLSNAIAKMNKNVLDAIGGSKQLQLWFKRAGLSIKDLKTLKPEQIFERILERVGKLPKDSAKAGALMQNIFGRSGANMLPMVDGFKDLTEEAERLGLVLSSETIEQGAKFNDTFDKLMLVLKGVGYTIGSILMPYFQEATEAITQWVMANRDLIATKVAEWIARLRENWPEIRQGALDAWDAIKRLVEFIQSAVDVIGGWGNAIAVVAAVMAGPLLAALATATSAIVSLGIALLTTPVGWLAAAIVAAAAVIAYAVVKIYKNWEPIKEFFSNLWGDIKKIFTDSIASIEEFLTGMWDRVAGLFSAGAQKVKGALSALNPMNAAESAWNWGKSLFTDDASNGAAVQPSASVMSPFALGAPAGAAPVAAAAGAARGQPQTVTSNAAVSVDFKNVPRGVEVTPGTNNTAPLDLSMGYSMVTP